MSKQLTTLSRHKLAALIGITTTQLHRLVTAGIIPKAARGVFDAEAALRAAFAYYRTTAKVTSTNYAEERIRLVQAQRKDIEDRTAQRSRNLISYEEHAATVFTVCSIYNSQLDGMGGRLANELAAESNPAVVRKRIFDETQRIRVAAAKEIEASAERPAPRRANGKTVARHDSGDVG